MKDNQHPDTGSRYARGSAIFAETLGLPADAFTASLANVAPRFARYVMEWEFADMVGESSIDARTREIVAITSLAMLGATAASVLRLRITSTLKAGVSMEEVIDIFIQLGVTAGFPIALAAIHAAQEQFNSVELV
ncbi:4-carboxymuconolactone decarboxylase [Paraburkholderia sp. BL6669N2]|uniref:carboxymuconolactone decarboxylase family protein n=1 Tax=Paraburkholderia sp. BL6669N2 TaxID=1938807 RepID=UPI000E23CE43|nr:carboxymuconolactone decarboxylase family protein [Paraburkholderia sp. BL6669N2]REG51038.1 4-carboxymuconolactone decarboxylase [Paraburkholderia sp. BL6669N2]